MSILDRALEKAAKWSPGRLAASIDRLRPKLAEGFGGPFNGQARRAEAIREIFAKVRFETIIETGTYRATTTLFLSQLADIPVATIEVNPRYYHYARRQLKGSANVTLVRADSATALRSLATRSPWNREPALFYLDAHWHRRLPLREELEAICGAWRTFAIVIDDFQVPDDSGYAYDSYGPGQSLELAILAPLVGKPIVIYWPAAPSVQETGARRGWIVLASAGHMDDSLRSIRTLRRSGSVASALTAHSSATLP